MQHDKTVSAREALIRSMIHGSGTEEKLEELLDILVDEKFSLRYLDNDKTPSTADRMSDLLAEFAGSWAFIIVFSIMMIAWIIINEMFMKIPFDPYPFILLNLILSGLGLHNHLLALFGIIPKSGCLLHSMKSLQFIPQTLNIQRVCQALQSGTDIIQFLLIGIEFNIHFSFPHFFSINIPIYYSRNFPFCKGANKRKQPIAGATGCLLLIDHLAGSPLRQRSYHRYPHERSSFFHPPENSLQVLYA